MNSTSSLADDAAPKDMEQAQEKPDATAGLRGSGLFTEWVDPQSGVSSWVLTRRCAPLQQSFYFVNPSWAAGGRYFWFYAGYPPGGSSNYGRSLGVVDLWQSSVRVYPETLFLDASPWVDKETAEVYWCTGTEIWKRGPAPEDRAAWVNALPHEWVRNRRPWRLATHLTRSADGLAFGIDVEIGREWIVGLAPLDGSSLQLWARFDRCYNHAQCSPVNPNLILAAQDQSVDPVTGELIRLENRLWLVHRDGQAVPIYPEADHSGYEAVLHSTHTEGATPRQIQDRRIMHGHEWWDPAGAYVWYIHYGQGVERVSLADRRPELVWACPVSHAHADARGRWLVADNLPPDDLSSHHVKFFNRATCREINLVSFMPQLPESKAYHVHPHPQFCCDDRLICYTTTVLGRVDVAFASVAELAAATG